MLILTRTIGTTLRIGSDILIQIKDIQRNQVRLGIEAPKHIPILRSELSSQQIYQYQLGRLIKE